jgi:hypothetical protein
VTFLAVPLEAIILVSYHGFTSILLVSVARINLPDQPTACYPQKKAFLILKNNLDPLMLSRDCIHGAEFKYWHSLRTTTCRVEKSVETHNRGLGDCSILVSIIVLNSGDSLHQRWKHSATATSNFFF